MTKRKILMGSAALIFIIFEAVMFYSIHFAKASSDYSLHYLSIIAATCFAWLTLGIELLLSRWENKKISEILLNKEDGNLIRIAMLFTLVADYFLVYLTPAKNLEGVIVFVGTQLFIFLHIFVNDKNKKVRTAQLITRGAVSFVLIIVTGIVLGRSTDPMALISVVYYANLCVNAIFAHRIGRGGIILTVGLVLFALCDINVGLSALNNIYDGGFPEGSFLYNLLHTDLDLIWIFYIPSQTLIPLTLLAKKENRFI